MKRRKVTLLISASLFLSGCTVWESTERTYYLPPSQDMDLGTDAWLLENDSQQEAGF